ncbi:hypothetical protein LP419_19610 [Massilia sp. H-1]|nr:hypothetical protein LP419_19610 [Massilia sp. H-1]
MKDRIEVAASVGAIKGDYQLVLAEASLAAGLRTQFAARDGAIVGMIDTTEEGAIPLWRLVAERALCVNTTAGMATPAS